MANPLPTDDELEIRIAYICGYPTVSAKYFRQANIVKQYAQWQVDDLVSVEGQTGQIKVVGVSCYKSITNPYYTVQYPDGQRMVNESVLLREGNKPTKTGKVLRLLKAMYLAGENKVKVTE